jgi:hypothetical protein
MYRKVIGILPHIVVFFLYSLWVILTTYPLIFKLGELTISYGDELLISWINAWQHHAISTNLFQLFQANIFYPYSNTLAYSHPFITMSLLTYIPLLFFKQPIAAQNLIIIFALITNGCAIYLLTYKITKNLFVSSISGFLIISSPVVLDKIVHVQVLLLFFVPLAMLSFYSFIMTKKIKYGIASAVVFVLQTYNSFLPGYFILLSWFSMVVFHYTLIDKSMLKKMIVLGTLSVLAVVPLILPYYYVSNEFHYVRDLRETIHLSLHPLDVLYPNGFTKLQPFLHNIQNTFGEYAYYYYKVGYPGAVFLLGIIGSIFVFLKKWKQFDALGKSIFTTGIVALVLSFGPFLHLYRDTVTNPFPIPLLYLPLYYLVPGFKGIRNVSQWEMLFVFCFSVIVGIVLHNVLRSVTTKRKYVTYSIIVVLIALECVVPLQFEKMIQIQQFPQVYSWIATLPTDAVIIEMPIYNWNMFPYGGRELMRNYYSTRHFRRSVNGASGFSPPPWQRMIEELMVNFPNQQALRKLQAIGVHYIIIHNDEYDELNKKRFSVQNKIMPSGAQVVRQLNQSTIVSPVTSFPNTHVYKVK